MPEVLSLGITSQIIIQFVQKNGSCQLSILCQRQAIGHIWDLASKFQNLFQTWGRGMEKAQSEFKLPYTKSDHWLL